jgi:hypothetical protein
MAKARRRKQRRSPKLLLGIIALVVVAVLLALLLVPGMRTSKKRVLLPEGLALRYGEDALSTALFYTCGIEGRLCPGNCEESDFLGTLGGVARLATLYEKWRGERKDCIIVDVGNAAIVQHEAAETINAHVFEALDKVGCEVVNCGENEIALPLDQLMALQRDRSFQMVSANLMRGDTGRYVFKPHLVIEREELRVGLVGLVRDDLPPNRIGKGLRLINPADALKSSVGALTEKEVDLIVVLACMTPEQIYRLARKFPQVGVFLGGRAKATSAPYEIENRSVIAYLADEGRTAGRLEPVFFPKEPHRVPVATGRVVLLTEELAEDAQLAELQARFEAALGDYTLPGADWDLKMPCTTSYVGSEVCRICHTKIFYSWQNTRHAGAYVTLLAPETQDRFEEMFTDASTQLHKNPECLACHATGYRMPSGFDPEQLDEGLPAAPPEGEAAPDEEAPRTEAERRKQHERVQKALKRIQQALKGVGCESCHGGARRHLGVAVKDRLLAHQDPRLREDPSVRSCLRCHTPERPCLPAEKSDPFDLEQYIEKIKHWQ